MIEALGEGLYVGMLIGEFFGHGPRLPVFGRPDCSNSLLPHLARRLPDAPVLGARVGREPQCSFVLKATDRIYLPCAANGQMDFDAATARLKLLVEGWIRQHPG